MSEEHQAPAFGAAAEAGHSGLLHTAAKYLKYWYVFALGLGLALAAAWLYLARATPEYSITSTVLIKDRKTAPNDEKNATFSDVSKLGYSDNIDNDIAGLKSVRLMKRALRDLGLEADYRTKGRFRNPEVYQSQLPFKLVFSAVDSAAERPAFAMYATGENTFVVEAGGQPRTYQYMQPVVLPFARFRVVPTGTQGAAGTAANPVLVQVLNLQQEAADYAHNLTVVPVSKQSTVLSLTLIDSVPARGEAVLNKVVAMYNQESAEDNSAQAASTLEFINKRLGGLEGELSNVEKGVEDFERQNDVADVNSQISQSLADAGTYSKQAAEFDVKLEVLRSIEKYITDDAKRDRLIPTSLSGQDASLDALVARYNDLQLRVEQMLRTSTEANPLVKDMLDERSALRTDILQNIRSTTTSLRISRNNLEGRASQSGSRIQAAPGVKRGLLDKTRQQETKRALYVYLLQKKEEASLALAATIAKTHVIDPAVANPLPVAPNKKGVLLLALLLGLGLPFGAVYLKEQLDDKVQDVEDVTRVTATPVLGELAHAGRRLEIGGHAPRIGPTMEMLRLIRANLQAALLGTDNKVLLVTSGTSGEGKSFFSLNLASSLAMAGKRTVLVQLDLRKVHVPLGSAKLGASDYFTHDSLSVDDIVSEAREVPGLYVVDGGALPENPAELLLSPRVEKLLGVLKQSFDYVIIDSAPVGLVADAFSLAPFLDLTLYVVRYNFTRNSQLKLLRNNVLHKLLGRTMLVFNDAREVSAYGYGDYYEPKGRR